MNTELVSKIVALFHGGASVRRIALSLGVSRRTVHKALGRVEQARSAGAPEAEPRPSTTRPSKLDAYEPAIADLLARYPDITVRRIHEELRPLGYTGGYTILSQRVLRLRPAPVVAPVRRFETAPGEQAQMDYSTYDLDFSDEDRRQMAAGDWRCIHTAEASRGGRFATGQWHPRTGCAYPYRTLGCHHAGAGPLPGLRQENSRLFP